MLEHKYFQVKAVGNTLVARPWGYAAAARRQEFAKRREELAFAKLRGDPERRAAAIGDIADSIAVLRETLPQTKPGSRARKVMFESLTQHVERLERLTR